MKGVLKSVFGMTLLAAAAAPVPGEASPCVPLTKGEAALAQGIFGRQISTKDMCKHFEPGYRQDRGAALIDGREIVFYGEDYHEKDYSRGARTYNRAQFVHEITHRWQRETKLAHTNGECKTDYFYALSAGKSFTDYCVERQAAIMEDYTLRFLEGVSTRWHAQLFGADTPESDELLRKIVEEQFPGARKMRLAVEIKHAAAQKTPDLYPR